MLKLNTSANVLSADGEIDVATAGEFEKNILQLVNQDFPVIILDLSKVSYLDSITVEILMYLKKNVLKSNQDIILRNPQEMTRKIFDLTGINKIFTIEETSNG